MIFAMCSLLFVFSPEIQSQSLKKEKKLQTAIGNKTSGRLTSAETEQLLKAREAVWRAFFTNDQTLLDRLVPEDTIVLRDSEEQPFTRKAEILESARQLAKRGAKLTKLEFPKTEIQVLGQAVIIYTTYLYDSPYAER